MNGHILEYTFYTLYFMMPDITATETEQSPVTVLLHSFISDYTPTSADEIQPTRQSTILLLCIKQRHNLSKTHWYHFPFTWAGFEQAFRKQPPNSTSVFAWQLPVEGAEQHPHKAQRCAASEPFLGHMANQNFSGVEHTDLHFCKLEVLHKDICLDKQKNAISCFKQQSVLTGSRLSLKRSATVLQCFWSSAISHLHF